MRYRKPKTPSGSQSRIFDDGYQDAKAGRVPLNDQLFETFQEYDWYMEGYNKRVGETNRPMVKDEDGYAKINISLESDPWNGYIAASGMSLNGSGLMSDIFISNGKWNEVG